MSERGVGTSSSFGARDRKPLHGVQVTFPKVAILLRSHTMISTVSSHLSVYHLVRFSFLVTTIQSALPK